VYELRPQTTNRSRNATASPPPSSVFNCDTASLDNPPAISRLEHRHLAGQITRQDVSQVTPLASGEPLPLAAPSEPLTGESHVGLLAPPGAFAASIGFDVCFEALGGRVGGWCDTRARRVVIDAALPGNAQVRVLVQRARARTRRRL
jgi:hypothetical protein